MNAQLAAVGEITEFFTLHGIRHFVIGGIANAVWGQPRATQDADFKVIVGNRSVEELVAMIGERFQFRIKDALAFAQRTYVLPVYASNRIPVDLGLGFLPYEEQSADRGVVVQQEGVSFVVCTAEDLIIHKAVSEREKDWSDIEGVLFRQGQTLDQSYITRWLEEFAEVLERPEILRRYDQLRNRAGRG